MVIESLNCVLRVSQDYINYCPNGHRKSLNCVLRVSQDCCPNGLNYVLRVSQDCINSLEGQSELLS